MVSMRKSQQSRSDHIGIQKNIGLSSICARSARGECFSRREGQPMRRQCNRERFSNGIAARPRVPSACGFVGMLPRARNILCCRSHRAARSTQMSPNLTYPMTFSAMERPLREAGEALRQEPDLPAHARSGSAPQAEAAFPASQANPFNRKFPSTFPG